jgi:hypothetical protein
MATHLLMTPHKPTYHAAHAQRGNAEIETLGVIALVILPILFIFGGMLLLGPTRLSNVFTSQREAYQSATTPDQVASINTGNMNITVTPADSDIPLDASNQDLDFLQSTGGINHTYEVQSQATVVSHSATAYLPAVTLTDYAQFAGSAWAYSSYPLAADETAIESWSRQDANDSTTPYSDSLELKDSWPPDGHSN